MAGVWEALEHWSQIIATGVNVYRCHCKADIIVILHIYLVRWQHRSNTARPLDLELRFVFPSLPMRQPTLNRNINWPLHHASFSPFCSKQTPLNASSSMLVQAQQSIF